MNRRQLIISSGIANSFEWYDYALFGHFSDVIGRKFFPSDDPTVELLKALMVFALGYLMRPVGGIFFGIIGDQFGRKVALSTSIMCMAIPTALIGVIPTYETFGIASTSLLIVVRMLQGISMGGALTSSMSFIVEHSPAEKRGLFGSIPMASLCVGILFGSLVAYGTKYLFTPEQFDSFAWRIPFILGVFIFFASVYIKNSASETPIFDSQKKQDRLMGSPLKTVGKYYLKHLFISIFINAPGSIIFYFQAIYVSKYLQYNRNFDGDSLSILVNICYVVMIISCLIAGYLSDLIGRKRIYYINLTTIIIFTPILTYIFTYSDFYLVAVAQLLLAVMAAFYIGPEPALQTELYPAYIRNTGLSVSYNLATSIFGGTTPVFIGYLAHVFLGLTAAYIYILVISILAIIALIFYKRTEEEVV